MAELQRYHDALARLSERDDIRDAPSRYQACALTLVEPGEGPLQGIPYPDYPPPGSLLDYNRMFQRLCASYDRRFVDSTLSLRSTTERKVWHEDSPLLDLPEHRHHRRDPHLVHRGRPRREAARARCHGVSGPALEGHVCLRR